MTWSRFDDGYDEHEKIEDAWFAFPPTPVGLHIMATTACNRWLSDGVVRPRWLQKMLPKDKDRHLVLEYMVKCALFDVLPAGRTISAVDQSGQATTLGPFDEDRYVVHDFLKRHDCATTIKAKRAKDAERKARARRPDSEGIPDGVRADSAGTPNGHRPESNGSPLRPHAGAPAPASRPDPTRPTSIDPLTPRAELAGEQTDHGDLTTRENARAVACPKCNAAAGSPCLGVQGQQRDSFHRERHQAAIADGAPVLTAEERSGRPRAPRPGAREGKASPRALGTNPRAVAQRQQREQILSGLAELDDEQRHTWAAVSDALRSVEAGSDSAWLSDLTCVGVDGAALVINAEGRAGASMRFIRERFTRWLVTVGGQNGVELRFATDAEHDALEQTGSAAA